MACIQISAYQLKIHARIHVLLLTAFLLLVFYALPAAAQPDTTLKNTLPAAGKMRKDKPSGKGWENLVISKELEAALNPPSA